MKSWTASSKKLNYTVEKHKAGKITFFSCCFLLLVLLVAGPAVSLRAQTPDTTSRAAKQFAQDGIRITTRDSAKTITPAAQRDSIVIDKKREHDPRKAAFYSAVLPGMGQVYNRDYWKVPIVYAALGVSTGVFLFNMDNYRTFRDAYRVRMANIDNPNFTDEWKQKNYTPENLKYLRDAYRQYVDYSVLVFVLAYGLNIVDATVFAHLKQFDMSDDLSMRLSPKVFNNRALGLSLTIDLGGNNKKKRTRSVFALGR